ncbi:MAG TPA: hypothetical protein VGG85_14895 [Terracidiphilus sp.]|jgi:hypothetical protein
MGGVFARMVAWIWFVLNELQRFRGQNTAAKFGIIFGVMPRLPSVHAGICNPDFAPFLPIERKQRVSPVFMRVLAFFEMTERLQTGKWYISQVAYDSFLQLGAAIGEEFCPLRPSGWKGSLALGEPGWRPL